MNLLFSGPVVAVRESVGLKKSPSESSRTGPTFGIRSSRQQPPRHQLALKAIFPQVILKGKQIDIYPILNMKQRANRKQTNNLKCISYIANGAVKPKCGDLVVARRPSGEMTVILSFVGNGAKEN